MAAYADYVIVPSTQEMFDLLRPGLPIRWLNGTVDQGWSYGVIETYEPEDITKAKITFSGAPMLVSATALEVGPREALRRISVSVPGTFANGATSSLILDDNKTYLTWSEGDAHLVKARARCITPDSTSAPTVNVTLDANPALSTGLIVTNGSWSSSGTYIDTDYYYIANGDSIEISTTQGGSGDAANLTVEMLFVQDRMLGFWDHGTRGTGIINLVISGAATTFCGMSNGIHAVDPNRHNIQPWAPVPPTTGTVATKSARTESWKKTYTITPTTVVPTQVLKFYSKATRPVFTGTTTPSLVEGGTTFLNSSFSVKFGTTSTVHEATAVVVPNLGGKILNRHMTSRTIGSTTFTWWKLGNSWASAFK